MRFEVWSVRLLLPLFLAGIATASALAATNSGPVFVVQGFQIAGQKQIFTDSVLASLTNYTGTNVSLAELGQAAAAVQRGYADQGFPGMTVAIGEEEIRNGIVKMTVFRAPVAQILISGRRFPGTNEAIVVAAEQTNAPPQTKTNAGPRFVVKAYEIKGDTLLTDTTLMSILTNYVGTNIGVQDILKAGSDIQMEYRNRGFPTVNVTIPPQQITNGIVQIRVFQGRLSTIEVVNNHFFSSNNIMRALPSLHTNTILRGPVFQAELDRANANPDRQIFPQVEPGPVENTSLLLLKVQDRLPLHAKVEFSDQSSPGTPELRLNTSAVYNNLWQHDHSLGLQYSFSPETYKSGEDWAAYDLPLVANYSGFYRMPISTPEELQKSVVTDPGHFGYDEATRKFRLPPSAGGTELNVYASRSTIDTGLEVLERQTIYNVPGVRQVFRQDVQDDLTVNEALGARLSGPLGRFANFQSSFSAGFDFKRYDLTSNKTNNFTFYEITLNPDNKPNPPIISSVASPVPTTRHAVRYLPLTFHWDGSERDSFGTTALGLGTSGNVWYSGSRGNLESLSGSTQSSGNWVILNGSMSRDQPLPMATNWIFTARADGQWASEPLISNEQFGVGGVAGVRGYREGEEFGDTGWRMSFEQKTPPHVIGIAYGRTPLTVRGSIYVDYGETYLLAPQGMQVTPTPGAPGSIRKSSVSLWGTGLGGVASIGPHWEARLLVTWPLLSTLTTEAYQPRFDFALNAQF
jgi:hemolysin activation/secretion protein